MAFKDVLRQLRQEDGLTQDELASKLNVSKSTISMYENGKRSPDLETLEVFADYFNVDLDRLLGREQAKRSLQKEAVALWDEYSALDDPGQRAVRAVIRELSQKPEAKPEPPRTKVIPLFGTAAAAGPGEMDTGMPWEDHEVPADSRADFAVRISGDSMDPVLRDGQIVLCKKGYPEIGDLVVVMVNGELLCKQFRQAGNSIFLLSVNRRRYDCDRILRPGSQDTVRCFGTVLLPRKIPLVNP